MRDVIIVGGSYAGLSAGIQLGRARRDVVVVDAGQRRNRAVAHAHGFLGQDGRDPAEIARIGRAELLAYPSVTWRDGTVVSATARGDDFAVALATGETLEARRLILATGVVDELPAISGLAERWGRHAFTCPYCHGYELERGAIGVIASGPLSIHHALLVSEWGRVTLFTRGLAVPDADQAAALARRGVTVEPGEVTAVTGDADVQLADGRTLAFAGLFVLSHTRPASPLASQLGCELETSHAGPFLKTDPMKETSVRGVFACGDTAVGAGSVAIAVGDGVRAGTAAHQSLVFR